LSQTSILIVAVIVAALLGYALARARGREEVGSQGRLSLDSQAATTATKLVVAPSSTSSAVADAVESTIASVPEPELPAPQPGVHLSIKMNFTRMFKLPSRELAEAIADREREKGMSVVVTPPDATDKNWRVTSTK